MPSNGDSDDDRAVLGRRSVLQSIGGAAALGTFATGAAGEDRPPAGGNYAVVQGEECVPVAPLSGDLTVEELYGLEIPERFGGDNGATDSGDGPYYQSNGTSDLQRPDTTVTFLYDGPNGLSLVTVHDTADSGSGTDGGSDDEGGAVSWTIENVPSAATWAVKDDLYLDSETGEPADRNFDDWSFDGGSHAVDWTWGSAGTDGGALRGLGSEFGLTIDPAFNERAALWGDYYAEDRITDWQILSFPDGRDSPRRTSLALDRRVTVRSGGCGRVSGEDRIDVRIDVKPGSGRNPVNPRSRGVIPVVLLAGDEFDPSSVDVGTLRFGPPRVVDDGGGARPAHGGHLGTVDGTVALVVHFRADGAGFETGDGEAKLVGRTDEGTRLVGTDEVTIVGNGGDDDREDERNDDGGEDDSPDDSETGDGDESGDRDEGRGNDDEGRNRDDEDESDEDGDEDDDDDGDDDDGDEEGGDGDDDDGEDDDDDDEDDDDEDDGDDDDDEDGDDDDEEGDEDGEDESRGAGRGNGRGNSGERGDDAGRGNGRGNGR